MMYEIMNGSISTVVTYIHQRPYGSAASREGASWFAVHQWQVSRRPHPDSITGRSLPDMGR
jgi:hypothetical protein